MHMQLTENIVVHHGNLANICLMLVRPLRNLRTQHKLSTIQAVRTVELTIPMEFICLSVSSQLALGLGSPRERAFHCPVYIKLEPSRPETKT